MPKTLNKIYISVLTLQGLHTAVIILVSAVVDNKVVAAYGVADAAIVELAYFTIMFNENRGMVYSQTDIVAPAAAVVIVMLIINAAGVLIYLFRKTLQNFTCRFHFLLA